MAQEDRIEEAEMILTEAQAIIAFLDEATDCLSRDDTTFIDEIHEEIPFGMHLCFEAALERIQKVRTIIQPEIEGR